MIPTLNFKNMVTCLGIALLMLTIMCFSIGFSMVLIHTFNILGGILIDKIDLFFGVQ